MGKRGLSRLWQEKGQIATRNLPKNRQSGRFGAKKSHFLDTLSQIGSKEAENTEKRRNRPKSPNPLNNLVFFGVPDPKNDEISPNSAPRGPEGSNLTPQTPKNGKKRRKVARLAQTQGFHGQNVDFPEKRRFPLRKTPKFRIGYPKISRI